ncbi:GerAB/ArcD/ProY family transporter [Paenibacillus thalictri]|uniref:Uncharacterized protein n=1 Tax=Paenibacillus thalictri TaxID=2527873 RepID=A0A4Q9DRQ7_9BACL|nr:GerAB/ArcD/ProY family transporter [Paenibacillus thalictri]TBL79484.1 hypothetical protein EYB31_11280 [Paenibacillus thalictri]
MNKVKPLAAFFIVHLSLMWHSYPQVSISSANSGHWEPIVLSLLAEAVLFAALLKGLSAFPNQSLMDIFDNKLKKWAARIVLLPFLCYLLLTLSLTTMMNTSLLTVTFLRDTPIWVLTLLLVIPLYAVRQGLEGIFRATLVFMIISGPVILFSLASTAANYDIHNVMPFWDTKLSFLSNPAYYSSLLAFSGFTVVGFFSGKDRVLFSRWRYILPAFLILLVCYLLFTYIPLLIFGKEAASKLQYAMSMSMDTVEIEWLFFDRLSLFYIIASLVLVFVYASLLLWMMVEVTRKLYLPVPVTYLQIGFTCAAYGITMSIPNQTTGEKLFNLDSRISIYCMVAVPVIVYMMSWSKRRSPV